MAFSCHLISELLFNVKNFIKSAYRSELISITPTKIRYKVNLFDCCILRSFFITPQFLSCKLQLRRHILTGDFSQPYFQLIFCIYDRCPLLLPLRRRVPTPGSAGHKNPPTEPLNFFAIPAACLNCALKGNYVDIDIYGFFRYLLKERYNYNQKITYHLNILSSKISKTLAIFSFFLSENCNFFAIFFSFFRGIIHQRKSKSFLLNDRSQ